MSDYGIAIEILEILNRPPLSHVEFDCGRVNLFIGPNASGKTTILRGINSLTLTRGDITNEEVGIYSDDGVAGTIYAIIGADEEHQWDGCDDRKNEEALPVLFIPATRVSLPGFTFPDVVIDTVLDPDINAPLDNLFDTRSGVFNGYYVEQTIRWLGEGNKLTWNQRNQLRRALDIGYSCARRICGEVLRDQVSHPFIEIDKNSSPERIIHYGMGIGTSDDILGEPLHAGALSSGTQGTLLWLYALAIKMALCYHWEDGWEKEPAILLIDEIENHLHPTWQRRVIPALLEHFPGLQIFATTHSPFVVAGLNAGQVHLLNRDSETGAVTASTNDRDVIGWTADEILRTMLGVDDPTDERTANAARELRQLRKEEYRSDPAEEEKRQERMRELRQLVDRDLLAGGPMARQREIFEEQFAESLRKYRESQSLNQENG